MTKELTFIGLGRMGAAMTARLAEEGYMVHAFDVNAEARTAATTNGATVYESLAEAVSGQSAKCKIVWVMVPSRFVDDVLDELKSVLSADDIIIDGGNSFFEDSLKRFKTLGESGIHFVDCGTSGGVEGARNGASLMVGGESAVVTEIDHIFKTLATTDGYGFVGGPGAGHFVKMVHNGIEYGMMGALAEGLNVLEEHSKTMKLDLIQALTAYEHGSIISSNLTSWLADSYNTPGYLENIAGEVPKGETEEEMEYIISNNDTKVLTAALEQRKATRTNASRIGTLVSAMRNQFGGHKTIVKPEHENN